MLLRVFSLSYSFDCFGCLLPQYPCNRKTYTHFSELITLTLTLSIVIKVVLHWCKLSCHTKLAAPKLTLTLANLFKINSIQTYTLRLTEGTLRAARTI